VFALPRNQDALYIARHRCHLRVRFPWAGASDDLQFQYLDEARDELPPGSFYADEVGQELVPVERPLRLEIAGKIRLKGPPVLADEERPGIDLTIGLTTTDETTTVTAVCGVAFHELPPNRNWRTVDACR
jgi:hypothetical protein